MHSTGLLVLSSHVSALCKGDVLSKILRNAKKLVNSKLYVHLNNAHAPLSDADNTNYSCLDDALSKGILAQRNAGTTFHADMLPFVAKFYSEASLLCNNIDVNILLHNIGTDTSVLSNPFNSPINCIMIDHPAPNHTFLRDFVASSLRLRDSESRNTVFSPPVYSVLEDLQVQGSSEDGSSMMGKYDATVIGGTFDRIHYGHKVLLSEAILLARKKLVIGVSDGPLLERKTLKELIQPVEDRKTSLKCFIRFVARPELELHLETITDPYGPSITVPDLDVILVSKETEKGGHLVNVKRKERGLSQLKVHVIGQGTLLGETEIAVDNLPFEEMKVSSSSIRFNLLGTLLKPARVPALEFIPESLPQPYVIGLTGGIAAGKSSIAKRLENLGAIVIDCDKLGHQSYLPGTNANREIAEHFGGDIVDDRGVINRRVLGESVFSDKRQMDKLNSIVWPEIESLCKEEIVKSVEGYSHQNVPVIVLDAAILLEAKWDRLAHEVWVVNIPAAEATARIMERNHLSEESAIKRIESQTRNERRTQQAHVVLSTLWKPSVTQKMVEKSWRALQERILKRESKRPKL